jgi:hypothetical protein
MQGERIDALLLRLLCEAPGPWQEAELEREFGVPAAIPDALGRLVGAGMAHRIEGFVFASASGRYAHDLDATWR